MSIEHERCVNKIMDKSSVTKRENKWSGVEWSGMESLAKIVKGI